MAIDVNATSKFVENPRKFLKGKGILMNINNNQIRPITATWQGQANQTNLVNKPGDSNLTYTAAVTQIRAADKMIVKKLAGNNNPIIKIGLTPAYGVDMYILGVSNEMGAKEVYYLPQTASQIFAIKLPATGPKLVITAGLSGCNIYITKKRGQNNDWAMLHSNARCVQKTHDAYTDKVRYQDELAQQTLRFLLLGYKIVRALKCDSYFRIRDNMIEQQQNKVSNKRNRENARATNIATSAFAFRKSNGEWDFFYQQGLNVESKKSGTRVVDKKKIILEDIPPVY